MLHKHPTSDAGDLSRVRCNPIKTVTSVLVHSDDGMVSIVECRTKTVLYRGDGSNVLCAVVPRLEAFWLTGANLAKDSEIIFVRGFNLRPRPLSQSPNCEEKILYLCPAASSLRLWPCQLVWFGIGGCIVGASVAEFAATFVGSTLICVFFFAGWGSASNASFCWKWGVLPFFLIVSSIHSILLGVVSCLVGGVIVLEAVASGAILNALFQTVVGFNTLRQEKIK